MLSHAAALSRFLSCDWGTSRLRLRLVARPDDAILAEFCSAEGVAQLAGVAPDERPEAFRQALLGAVNHIAAERGTDVRDLPIVISGMASSSIGWQELPYAALPLPLDGSGLVWKSLGRLEPDRGGQVVLISGLASADDVMRGEEIEALGAARLMSAGPLADEGILLLPGTHSKHIHVRAGHIVGFQTFMTGELFDVLSTHSVLRHSVTAEGVLAGNAKGRGAALPAQSNWASVAAAAFDEGVRLGAVLPLAAALFQVRTRGLLSEWLPAQCRQSLSGILIAAELAALRQPCCAQRPIVLAAPPALSDSYARAADGLGLAARLTVFSPTDTARLAVVGQSLALPRIQSAG